MSLVRAQRHASFRALASAAHLRGPHRENLPSGSCLLYPYTIRMELEVDISSPSIFTSFKSL
ncbi:hypothetical protein CRG98_041193 [Punica granatum]|uniref:Uncharacterized protein n=1 Tax=Punica granatum TaxID=22663 RepID=A0A2I0I3J5_PUNGR|nr:hypothetical protein CRG98_041193 [Punica granatum]